MIKMLKNGKSIFKQFIISKDEMDKFEQEELKKEKKIVKNSWFSWLINYVPTPMIKIASDSKDKILILYNSKTNKVIRGSRKKVSKLKIREESKDNLIKNTRSLFELKKVNKAIKDKIIRDIRNLFELENKDYYKQIRVSNFYSNNYK